MQGATLNFHGKDSNDLHVTISKITRSDWIFFIYNKQGRRWNHLIEIGPYFMDVYTFSDFKFMIFCCMMVKLSVKNSWLNSKKCKKEIFYKKTSKENQFGMTNLHVQQPAFWNDELFRQWSRVEVEL